MTSGKRTGRIVGALLVLQLAGIIIPFVLLHPLASIDYIATAASYTLQIKVAVLVFFASGAVTIGISIAAWRVFRRQSEPMAIWLIVLSVICFMLQAVDNVHIMSMLSLSQQYAAGGGSEEIFNTLAALVRSTRRWAHYPWLLGFDFWLAVFFAILLRFALVPRPLAGLVLLTVAVQFVAVPLAGFFGYPITTNLGLPMAFGLLTTAIWLVVKGFDVEILEGS